MNRILMGIETEYALAVVKGHSSTLSAPDAIMDAVECLPHLPCSDGPGIFLANGSRLYIDSGAHPEFCTPEVENVADLVRYVIAGDQLLHQLSTNERLQGRGCAVRLFKCNVDYANPGTTWACHENYACRHPSAAIAHAPSPEGARARSKISTAA